MHGTKNISLRTGRVWGKDDDIFLGLGNRANKERVMFNRKAATSAFAMPLIIGLIGLMHLMHQERFASFRGVDVLQMIGSGMCFGVALSALFAMIRGQRSA
jgi:hypothetical protein